MRLSSAFFRELACHMDRAASQDQIDRIVQSKAFAGKTQLVKLLQVLFDRMDSQATLKPDCVIRELWPTETRTKRSADVATEINRLRKALECYYDGEGVTDPIVICLPNRSALANGVKEKRWIAAEPRAAKLAEVHPPVAHPAIPHNEEYPQGRVAHPALFWRGGSFDFH